MKHLLILSIILVVTSANTVNFCGQNSCCSTPSCNNCANNCRYQCSSESCTNTCIDNCIQTIPQTCTGGSCNVCSGSQCCNSQSCNSCANACASHCTTPACKTDCVDKCIQTPSAGCTSNYCNQCANTCTNQCTTQTCKNNCVNKCIETSPSCIGENCNVCVGGQCCNNQNCNSCVNQCYGQTSGCTRACVRQCIQPEPVKIPLPIPERECNNLEFSNDFASHDRSNHTANIETNIDLTNIINNTNHIHVPIRINNTNINNVNYPKRTKLVHKDVTFINQSEKQNTTQAHGCCYVLHPKECVQVQKEIKCYRRRHRECSAICTSPVVLIAPQPHPVPIPQPYPIPYPINNQQQKCHYMQQYPYVYCGNYQKHDCGACYNCGAGYQPQQCATRPQCPSACRNNLVQR